jgi:hypothetical protein
MMELALFKEPFVEPWAPERLRLLFERTEDKNTEKGTVSDFYLYAWIDDREYCSGFQAIMDDEFVLEFHAPSHLTFGRISAKPLGRAITQTDDGDFDKEREMILARMKSMYCDQFPDLIKKIGEVAQRNTSERITLTIDEKKYLGKLLKKR